MDFSFFDQLARNTYNAHDAIAHIHAWSQIQELKTIEIDDTRPWGGFIAFAESQAPLFLKLFFYDTAYKNIIQTNIRPKILFALPHARLSWQWHERRSEIWRAIGGEVRLMRNNTDSLDGVPIETLPQGDVIGISQGTRHRLIGGETYPALVAELWQHTDVAHPSHESDNHRVQDDFGRS